MTELKYGRTRTESIGPALVVHHVNPLYFANHERPKENLVAEPGNWRFREASTLELRSAPHPHLRLPL